MYSSTAAKWFTEDAVVVKELNNGGYEVTVRQPYTRE